MKFFKKIFKFLFSTLFLLLLFVGVLTLVFLKLKPEKLPFQNLAKKQLYYSLFPDSAALAGIDTVLTPEEELSIEIDSRRKILDEWEQRLREDEAVVTSRWDSIKAVQEELERLSVAREQLETERIDKLVKVFESMRAQEAANVVAELDDRTIIRILVSMQDRQAAKILQELDAARAAEISQRLTRIR